MNWDVGLDWRYGSLFTIWRTHFLQAGQDQHHDFRAVAVGVGE